MALKLGFCGVQKRMNLASLRTCGEIKSRSGIDASLPKLCQANVLVLKLRHRKKLCAPSVPRNRHYRPLRHTTTSASPDCLQTGGTTKSRSGSTNLVDQNCSTRPLPARLGDPRRLRSRMRRAVGCAEAQERSSSMTTDDCLYRANKGYRRWGSSAASERKRGCRRSARLWWRRFESALTQDDSNNPAKHGKSDLRIHLVLTIGHLGLRQNNQRRAGFVPARDDIRPIRKTIALSHRFNFDTWINLSSSWRPSA